MADDDGLKWLLELDVKQDEALSFLKTLDKMQSSLKGTASETDKVEASSGRAAHGHKKHGEEAKGLHGILDRLVHAGIDPFLNRIKQVAEFEFIRKGVDALIEAPMEIARALKDLGEEMLTVAGRAERTNKSVELLFGKPEGADVLEYLEKIAGATEFTDLRLKGAAQSLAKVGFKGSDLTRAIAASLDIAAFSSNKEEGFGEALASLERIKRTGRVDNRVLGGLGIGGKDFLAELSKRTGEGAATLKKKLEKGTVDSGLAIETLYSMIAKKTGKDLGGAGLEVGKGFEARMTHLKDLPDQFFQRLANSDGLVKFTEAIASALETLDPDSPLGQKIFSTLESAFNSVADTVRGIDLEVVFETAKTSIETSIELVKDLGAAFGVVVEFGSELISTLESIVTLGHLTNRLGLTGGGDEQSAPSAAAHEKFVSDQRALREQGRRDRISRQLDFMAPGLSMAAGLSDGMKAGHPAVADAAAKLGTVAADATSKALGIHSPSKVFADFGRMSAAGFVEGIDASASAIDSAVSQMFSTTGPAAAGGARGVTVQVSPGAVVIQVSVGGSNSSADSIATEVARAVESVFPGALQSALANIALQGGAVS